MLQKQKCLTLLEGVDWWREWIGGGGLSGLQLDPTSCPVFVSHSAKSDKTISYFSHQDLSLSGLPPALSSLLFPSKQLRGVTQSIVQKVGSVYYRIRWSERGQCQKGSRSHFRQSLDYFRLFRKSLEQAAFPESVFPAQAIAQPIWVNS